MKLSDELKSAGRIVVLVMVILFLSVTTCLATGKTGLSASDLTVSVNQKKNLKLRNSSGKITWKILSGKECISVKRSGNKMVVVTGKKKGTAVIQAKNKEKNFTCRVTVKSRLPENRPQGGDGQQTQQGDNTFETDNIEDTLISLLCELKQKKIQVIDIKIDRGTLEQHFIEMARRETE